MLNCQKENVPKAKKPQNVDADFSSDEEDLSQVKDGAANCRSKIDKIIGRLGEKPISMGEFQLSHSKELSSDLIHTSAMYVSGETRNSTPHSETTISTGENESESDLEVRRDGRKEKAPKDLAM